MVPLLTMAVTIVCLHRILRGCTQLTELNLGWTYLTVDSLTAITRALRPELRRLNLSGNRETLMDSHVEDILNNCPSLRELDISGENNCSVVV